MSDQLTISKKKQKIIIYISLTLATIAVFWQVNQFDFINFDDPLYVTENSHVQSRITLDEFSWASRATDKLWTPLLWLSFMLDYKFYGLNAGGYHVTNLILHIMSALLLFWLFNRMTGAIWKSAFVAAFFALHPLHVESVAWITERKDVLSAFFWMLTLCLYVYYTEKPAVRRYLLVVFSFVLALMSKPMVVTLPVIMILLDYWPLKRFESQKNNLLLWQLKEKLLFFVLSAVLSVITLYDSQKPDWPHFPLILRLCNVTVSFMTYLEKTFRPHDMAIFYPFPEHIPLWQVGGAIILIIVITTFVIIVAKRLPHLFVGWMWFTITILPVTGIIYQMGEYAMADRYHYLSSIGIAFGLAWGVPLLFPSADARKKILFPAAIAFLAILTFLSWKQCGYWKNNTTLWNHALNVTKDNYMAHNNLASALLEKGDIQKAVYHYNRAISINNYSKAHYNMGIIYYRLGQYQQSIGSFNQAIRVKPYYAAAYYNLGIVYYTLGQYQHAIESYNETIRLMPDYANAYNNRAIIYLNQRNNFPGCTNAQKACKLGICKTLIWAKGRGICN